jgi:hypothetical protein
MSKCLEIAWYAGLIKNLDCKKKELSLNITEIGVPLPGIELD